MAYSSRGKRRALFGKILWKASRKCVICGKLMDSDTKSFEHVIPESLGGKFKLNNLVLTHKACNRRRGTRPLNNIEMFRCRIILLKVRKHFRDRYNENRRLVGNSNKRNS